MVGASDLPEYPALMRGLRRLGDCERQIPAVDPDGLLFLLRLVADAAGIVLLMARQAAARMEGSE